MVRTTSYAVIVATIILTTPLSLQAQGVNSSQVEGEWHMRSIDGIPIPDDTMMILNGDGTMGLLSFGESILEGTWTLSDQSGLHYLLVEQNGAINMEFTVALLSDGTMQLTSQGTTTIWSHDRSDSSTTTPTRTPTTAQGASEPPPTGLSAECGQYLAVLEPGEIHPTDFVGIVFEACPELSHSADCREAAEALATVAVEDRMRVLVGGCWLSFCPDGMAALESSLVGPAERAPVLRSTCQAIVGSDLLTEEEFARLFDSSILETLSPGTDAYWEAAARLDFGTWFLAEMLYSQASALPESDRLLLREIFRTALLFEPAE